MKPELILHIGTEKTGTSTIQAFLSRNRAVLRPAGVLAPRLMHRPRAVRLAACCDVPPWPLAGRHFAVDSQAALEDLRGETLKRLDARLADRPYSRVVISNEHFHSLVRSPAQLDWLQEVVSSRFDGVRVVVYFRRQDRLAVSRWSTSLRAGFVSKDPFQFGPGVHHYFSHLGVYRLWSEVFGRDRMTVRLFERERFAGGNVLDDFLDAAGLPRGLAYQPAPVINEALSADAAAVLTEFNTRIIAGRLELSDRDRRATTGLVAARYPGPPRLPLRAHAETFYLGFAEENAALQEELGLSSWFDDDFSMYPERLDDVAQQARARWAVDELDRVFPILQEEIRLRRLAES